MSQECHAENSLGVADTGSANPRKKSANPSLPFLPKRKKLLLQSVRRIQRDEPS